MTEERMLTDRELGIWTGIECELCCEEIEDKKMQFTFHALLCEEVQEDGSVKTFWRCRRTGRRYQEQIRSPKDGQHRHRGYGWHSIKRKHSGARKRRLTIETSYIEQLARAILLPVVLR